MNPFINSFARLALGQYRFNFLLMKNSFIGPADKSVSQIINISIMQIAKLLHAIKEYVATSDKKVRMASRIHGGSKI